MIFVVLIKKVNYLQVFASIQEDTYKQSMIYEIK